MPNQKKSVGYTLYNPNVMFVTQHLFKSLPYFIGLFGIYLGYRLFILGVSGNASLSIDTKTIKGQLINASPGLLFALFGTAIIVTAIWKGGFISIRSTKKGLYALANSIESEETTHSGDRSEDVTANPKKTPN